jgi:hypothetical protein
MIDFDLAGFETFGQALQKAAQQFAHSGAAMQEAIMALKIKSKPATATTTKTMTDKKTVVSEDTQQEQIDTPADPNPTEPQCEVGVEMSYTHNLGNYQSARVQVSLKVPCVHAEIDDIYNYAREWVDNKLNGLVEELQAE